MKNVLRVLKRDILRLLKTPAALVVVVALLILPSLYTWYNVLGFWNPYENTGALRVDVVNEDAGATSDLTGPIDVGDMIVDNLKQNDQLGWQFSSRDEAMEALRQGESYAVFVVPADFSAKLLSLATPEPKQPDIQYYVNEKTGPVSPKITDTGATTLDETINAAFVSTVSDVVVEQFEGALDASKAAINNGVSQALAEADDALAKIQDAENSIAAMNGAVSSAQGKTADVQDALGRISEKTDSLAADLPELEAEANSVAHSAEDFAQKAAETTSAVVDALDELLQDYLAKLKDAIEKEPSIPEADDALRPLPPGEMADLESAAANIKQLIKEAQALSELLNATLLPSVGSASAAVESAFTTMNGMLLGQQSLLEQLDVLSSELGTLLSDAQTSLAQTQSLLQRASQEVGSIKGDLQSLAESDALVKLFGEDGLDADRIAEFMGAPTQVETEQLYQLNAYGSAMAPLFMNLTFWIGAFMLLVIMRQEVDSEGIRNLTLTQRYVGRFVLFAILAVLQSAVCVVGVLLIGVQTVSLPALFFASAMASLAYLSIIYALSVTLQHIGKGICIILVFAQIPGATGLYPVEMTSPFFQTVYPFLPFTYGISAMREAICGFYGSQYAEAIAMLLVFFIVFLLAGILMRPLMGNVNRMVASQVRQSGIFNGEDVDIPVRTLRASQMLRVLSNQEEFKDNLLARYARFERWYPRMIRASVVLGVAVPVVLVLVFALTPTEKVILLTLWLVWIAALFIFLIVVETLRFNLKRQLAVLEGDDHHE